MVTYTQNFSMPVITHQPYAPILSATTVTANALGRYGLTIQVSNSSYWQLLTMASGVVYFFPPGTDPHNYYGRYPDLPPLLPGTGFIRQRLWMLDVKKLHSVLPEGVPAVFDILYFNVDPVSFRLDATPWLAPLSTNLLKTFGALSPSATRADYCDQLLDLLVQGQVGLHFPGGAPCGKMASNSFTLFFAGLDDVGVSPVPYLRAMPNFAGTKWIGHPLIGAVANASVPIDIYAEFNVWSAPDNAPKPLPDGLPVRLINHNLLIDDTLATQLLSNGSGKVVFNLTDAQLQQAIAVTPDAPDLLFEIDLGAANPEPGMIGDPWDSSASSRNDTLSPNKGYFADFAGTRLGSATAPLQYQIGLGFWKYLINQRPSAALQQTLQAQGRHWQPVQEAYHTTIVDVPSQTTTEVYSSISLDYYAVRVTQLPSTCATPEALMSHIRTHFDEFYDHSVSLFKTTDSRWTDPNSSPVGVVLAIDFYLLGASPDSGSVVVSGYDSNGGFTVNTISDPGFGVRRHHPLGGMRHWGFVTNPDGSYTFFTRGADRPYQQIDHMGDFVIFNGADKLWKSLQRRIKKYVEDHNGAAEILNPFAERFSWEKVRDLYWVDDPNNPPIPPPP